MHATREKQLFLYYLEPLRPNTAQKKWARFKMFISVLVEPQSSILRLRLMRGFCIIQDLDFDQ